MKYKALLSILLILIGQSYGQENNCFEKAEGLYWPIEIGSELKHTAGNDNKVSVINGDSIEFDSKYYLIERETYQSGKTKESYWREENGAVYNYNKEKGIESMELPSRIEVGTKWNSSDGLWSYEIVSLTSNYSTPFCEFRNLLEVKTENSEQKGTIYNLYYKQGVGLIGLNVNGTPYSFIVPNKELNQKNFMAYGCEELNTEKEIQSCTYSKIFEHIKSNYKAPKKFKKGRMLLNAIIGKDGGIESVKIVKTIPNAEAQEIEALRVIKLLPKFIPAQIDDGQPVRSSLTVPFNF
ncbi:energy transducer TonB [Fulvivirga sp.]|uniref:energy transducer TonB n=1 Tax=Fulvivirga sp. TaxID=1931237 RepID=UPI0032ECF07A